MGKNKKDLGPTDKIYSLEDVDQMTMAQFQDGQRKGMYQCHDITNDSIERLRRSLEDVWAIEYSGVITPEKKARVEEITFAINTLTTLDDMFQGKYDTELDLLNKESGEDYV
jgi:hypothetical protein